MEGYEETININSLIILIFWFLVKAYMHVFIKFNDILKFKMLTFDNSDLAGENLTSCLNVCQENKLKLFYY